MEHSYEFAIVFLQNRLKGTLFVKTYRDVFSFGKRDAPMGFLCYLLHDSSAAFGRVQFGEGQTNVRSEAPTVLAP